MNSRTRKILGFSLIELMVGIVVAMLAMIIIMQLFQNSEGARRTTTSGDDAQTTGAISLAMLQRDLRQAGQGLMDNKLLSCDITIDGGRLLRNLSGFAINHQDVATGDADTDTLLVAYGDGDGSPQGDRIISQPSTTEYAVATPTAFLAEDRVIATPSTPALPCAVVLDRVVAPPANLRVEVATGSAGVANGTLFNLGLEPVIRAYAIRDGKLVACNYRTHNCSAATADAWTPVADGVVALRAQYARDTSAPMDATVDTFDQTTPTTACGWLRTTGLRLAITVRSGQLEKDDVTEATPEWAGHTGAPISLPGANWKKYRYKTYETVLPLRNTTVLGVIGTC